MVLICSKCWVLWKTLWHCLWITGFLCPWSSWAVEHCLVMNVLDFVRTSEPSQEGASLSEWACLSHWHWCQKLLGSHPRWDKWSFWFWEYGTVPSFDVWALKDCRWRQEGLSRMLHPQIVDICGTRWWCVVVFLAYFLVDIVGLHELAQQIPWFITNFSLVSGVNFHILFLKLPMENLTRAFLPWCWNTQQTEEASVLSTMLKDISPDWISSSIVLENWESVEKTLSKTE